MNTNIFAWLWTDTQEIILAKEQNSGLRKANMNQPCLLEQVGVQNVDESTQLDLSQLVMRKVKWTHWESFCEALRKIWASALPHVSQILETQQDPLSVTLQQLVNIQTKQIEITEKLTNQQKIN